MKENSFHAKILNNKYLPKSLKFAIIIFANWLFHGFLYMDRTERVFYLVLDGFFFLLTFPPLLVILTPLLSIFIALIIAHTLHWLFNGHLLVLLKNLSLSTTEMDQFAEYIKGLRERARREKSIHAIAAFGSLSRGKLTKYSDLDIRIIRRQGVVNGIRVCVFTFLERSRALMSKIPLDVYTYDDFRSLLKLSPDELPIALYDPQNSLIENYKQGRGASS